MSASDLTARDKVAAALKALAKSLVFPGDRDTVFKALVDVSRAAGFGEIAFIQGQITEDPTRSPPYTIDNLAYLSSCDDAWLRQIAGNNDIQEDIDFLKILKGQSSPFVSGYHLKSEIGPLSPAQDNVLRLKAEQGFAANLVVPIMANPRLRPATAAMVYLSRMHVPKFFEVLSEHYLMLTSAAYLAATCFLRAASCGQTPTVLEVKPKLQHAARATCALTDRQRLVLQTLASGAKPAEIAADLSITKATVDFHLARAREALHARTTAEAVAKAIKLGEIEH